MITIAAFKHDTVPGLEITITKNGDTYSATRKADPSSAYRWNYLSAGRGTEPEAREVANTLWADAVKRATPAPAPVEVPAGRYALVSDGVVKFYKIDRPTEGRWAGRVFVKILASDTEYPVRGQGARSVLTAIGADVSGASLRYGREIGACGVCGRTLTDEASRAAGIGPVCASKMGW